MDFLTKDTDKVPYYVTILFALAGWAMVHTVNRLVDSPVIEYQVESREVRPNVREVTVSLTNLSRKETFRSLEFLLRMPKEPKDFRFHESTASEPVTVRTHAPTLPAGFSTAVDPGSVLFKIPVLAAGGRVDLLAYYSGSPEPILLGTPNPRPDEGEGDSFALVEASLSTALARHELTVIWIAVALWPFMCLVIMKRGAIKSYVAGLFDAYMRRRARAPSRHRPQAQGELPAGK